MNKLILFATGNDGGVFVARYSPRKYVVPADDDFGTKEKLRVFLVELLLSSTESKMTENMMEKMLDLFGSTLSTFAWDDTQAFAKGVPDNKRAVLSALDTFGLVFDPVSLFNTFS
jgi:hypothetical protein